MPLLVRNSNFEKNMSTFHYLYRNTRCKCAYPEWFFFGRERFSGWCYENTVPTDKGSDQGLEIMLL